MPWQAGDIGASSGNAALSRLIQTGQKWHGDPWWEWNHIFIVVDPSGTTIEAGGHGVEYSTVASHAMTMNLGCPAGVDRTKVVKFCQSQLDVEYGYFDDALLGFDCLTHLKLAWRGDSLICSELGALALHAGGWDLLRPAALTMPADLILDLKRAA